MLGNISKTMFVMGILIFIGGLIGMFVHRKFSKKIMIFMGAVYLTAGASAFFIVEHYYESPKNDVEIILSDFDEQAESVFLSQVVVDGEEYNLEHMKSGNWVWQNNSYGWKNSSGTVLEDIDTDVIVEIPIGYVRTLNFNVNADGVKIQVREDDDTVEQVLYRGGNLVQLKEVSSKQVYLAKFIKIAFFVILFAIFIIIIQFAKKYWTVFSMFCKKNRFYITLLVLSFLSFLFMWRYAGDESFWSDEVFTVGLLKGQEKPNSLWIALSVMRFCMSIVPYGQQYLLLPEIILVVCSVYIIGLVGRRICSEWCGIIASALTGFSAIIWIYAAFEFRPYAFMLFYSILAFYLLLIRNTVVKHKYFFCILYGISLLLLMDSHEYGKVMIACYLVLDVILLIGEKINIRYFLTWAFPLMYGIYWVLNNDIGGLWNNYGWPENPTIEIVSDTFMLLCNRQWFLVGLFLCGLVYVIKLLVDYLKGVKSFAQVNGYFYLLYMIIGIFSCSIVYSNYINPENSLYVNRYFISVIAYVYIIIAAVISKVIEYIMKEEKNYLNKQIVTISISSILIFNGWQAYRGFPAMHYEDNKGSAEWMKDQEDIYDDDVALVYAEWENNLEGWLYYFNQGKDQHLPQVVCQTNMDDLHDLPYKKIYVVSMHFGIQELPKYIDNKKYKSTMEKKEYGIKVYEKVEKRKRTSKSS